MTIYLIIKGVMVMPGWGHILRMRKLGKGFTGFTLPDREVAGVGGGVPASARMDLDRYMEDPHGPTYHLPPPRLSYCSPAIPRGRQP